MYEAYSKSIAEPVKPNDQRIFCNYCHTRFKSPKCTNLRHVDGELVLIESNLSERSDPSLKAGKRDEVSYNRGFHEKKAECTTRSQERNLEDRSVHFNKRPSEFYGRNFSDREVSNRGNDFVNRDVGYRRRDINDRDVGYRNRDYSQRLVDGGQRHNPQMSSAYGNSTADESYYKKQNSWENLSRKYDDRSSQGYQNIGEVRGRDSWMPKNTNIGNVKKDDLSASIGKSSSYTSADYQKVDKNDVMKIISRWTNVDKSYSDTLEKIGYQVNHDGSNGSIEKLSNSAENYSKSQDKQIKYLQCESHEPSFQITDLGRKKNLEGYDKISNVYRLANSNYTFPDQSSGDSETKNIKIEQKKNSKGFGVEWADIMGKELMVLHRFSKDVEFEPEDPTNYSDPNLVDEDCEEEVCETTPFLYLPRHI